MSSPKITNRPPPPASPVAADATPKLVNNGGKVLGSPNLVPIYYGNYWASGAGKDDARYLDGFAADIGKSRYTSVWAEYGVGQGRFGGSDTVGAAAPKTVSDAQIRQIVKKELAAGKVSGDGQTVYTVFLPPGTVLRAPDGSTSKQGLGGYHGSFTGADGKPVYYAAIVYSQGQNGIDFDGKARDNVSITASHEWTEAATDPDVNHGKLGWYDDTYGEIGDIPINAGMPIAQVWDRVDGYAVQKEWSNRDGRAEVSEAPNGITGNGNVDG